MYKCRRLLVFLVVFSLKYYAGAQDILRPVVYPADTMPHRGFSDYREAADTLWQLLARNKTGRILTYTMSEAMFQSVVRRQDTVTPSQFVRGQWIAYWNKVEKSYLKTRKTLKKQKVSLSRSRRDTVFVTRDAGNPAILRIEVYFFKGKQQGAIRFYLWQVGEMWYLVDRMVYTADQSRLR